jgi:hypothetical protein
MLSYLSSLDVKDTKEQEVKEREDVYPVQQFGPGSVPEEPAGITAV